MNPTTTIFFDMDGTIADLYGVENWLDYLTNKNPYPYKAAAALVRLNTLARKLNALQKKGYKIGIISWLCKGNDFQYDTTVTKVKLQWLKKHLPSVNFDEIHIIPYGIPKEQFAKSETDILFDDEKSNRENWLGRAFPETQIFEILNSL